MIDYTYLRHLTDCLTYNYKNIKPKAKCSTCEAQFETQNLYDWHSCVTSKLKCPKCYKTFTSAGHTFKHIVRCNVTKNKNAKTQLNKNTLLSKDTEKAFSNSNAFVCIPSSSSLEVAPQQQQNNTIEEKYGNKKNKKLTKKDMQRFDNLLKNAYVTLQNIKFEPKEKEDKALPLVDSQEHDQLNDFHDYDSDGEDNIELPNDIEIKHEAIEISETGLSEAMTTQKEQLDEKPIIRLKIKKEHGTLNSSIISDEKNLAVAATRNEDSNSKKKKRKKKRTSTDKDNSETIFASINIKQEIIEEDSDQNDDNSQAAESSQSDSGDTEIAYVPSLPVISTVSSLAATSNNIIDIKPTLPIIACHSFEKHDINIVPTPKLIPSHIRIKQEVEDKVNVEESQAKMKNINVTVTAENLNSITTNKSIAENVPKILEVYSLEGHELLNSGMVRIKKEINFEEYENQSMPTSSESNNFVSENFRGVTSFSNIKIKQEFQCHYDEYDDRAETINTENVIEQNPKHTNDQLNTQNLSGNMTIKVEPREEENISDSVFSFKKIVLKGLASSSSYEVSSDAIDRLEKNIENVNSTEILPKLIEKSIHNNKTFPQTLSDTNQIEKTQVQINTNQQSKVKNIDKSDNNIGKTDESLPNCQQMDCKDNENKINEYNFGELKNKANEINELKSAEQTGQKYSVNEINKINEILPSCHLLNNNLTNEETNNNSKNSENKIDDTELENVGLIDKEENKFEINKNKISVDLLASTDYNEKNITNINIKSTVSENFSDKKLSNKKIKILNNDKNIKIKNTTAITILNNENLKGTLDEILSHDYFSDKDKSYNLVQEKIILSTNNINETKTLDREEISDRTLTDSNKDKIFAQSKEYFNSDNQFKHTNISSEVLIQSQSSSLSNLNFNNEKLNKDNSVTIDKVEHSYEELLNFYEPNLLKNSVNQSNFNEKLNSRDIKILDIGSLENSEDEDNKSNTEISKNKEALTNDPKETYEIIDNNEEEKNIFDVKLNNIKELEKQNAQETANREFHAEKKGIESDEWVRAEKCIEDNNRNEVMMIVDNEIIKSNVDQEKEKVLDNSNVSQLKFDIQLTSSISSFPNLELSSKKIRKNTIDLILSPSSSLLSKFEYETKEVTNKTVTTLLNTIINENSNQSCTFLSQSSNENISSSFNCSNVNKNSNDNGNTNENLSEIVENTSNENRGKKLQNT